MKNEKIVCGGVEYVWDDDKNGYYGRETSCGCYGTALTDNKWVPAWIPCDSYEDQWGDEFFDHSESAISRSHSYFS